MSKQQEEVNETRVRKQVVNRRLLCTLTPQELQLQGAKLAEACEDIQNETQAQTDIKAQLKSKITSLEAHRGDRLMSIHRSYIIERDENGLPLRMLWHGDDRPVPVPEWCPRLCCKGQQLMKGRCLKCWGDWRRITP